MNKDVDIPLGNLDEIAATFLAEIARSPDGAWNILTRDPLMVLVLSRTIRFLKEKDECNGEEKVFIDRFEQEVKRLFVLDDKKQKLGSALFAELLLENWRREFDGNLLQTNPTIRKNLDELLDEFDGVASNIRTKIIKESVIDFDTRLSSLKEYEEDRIRISFGHLQQGIERFITEIFSQNDSQDIQPQLQALLEISSFSIIGANVFREELSSMVLTHLRNLFSKAEDELKFKLAPWLQLLERLQQ
ncbi:MAG: hypothetical protein INQ03_16325 [Candidatus Heimdallarchaeota archaeon]|nr:hypothetical protein [Candidatus Heimdallarchaeota archaeon]